MWPFKKKKRPSVKQEDIFESVLCIPGNWRNWDEFILQIVTATGGEYIPAAGMLFNAKTERHYTISFCEHDSKMKKAFQYAGMANRVSDPFLETIDKHAYVVYLSGRGGSLQEAEHIARAGFAVLKAGGIGIKIESAGKAFEKEQWEKYFENFDTSNLYDMFVVESIFDSKNNSTYSCGMQNIGLKDTIIFDEEFQLAVKVIRSFSFYQIVDKPTIQNDQTFNPLIIPAIYRINEEVQQPYEGSELFANPFGMWRLSRV